MRPMPLVLALIALAAVAAAGPAAARSVLGAVPPVPMRPAPGFGAVRPGPGPGPGFHRRRPNRFDGDALPLYGGFYGYDEAPEAAGGFFAEGEAVPARGGVRYLYDRGYPYDHYRPAGARFDAWQEPGGCSTRWEGPIAVHSCRR
jgi:hypothetical protein